METTKIKKWIKQYPSIQKFVLRFLMHPVKTRPQWWVRALQFYYLQKGKNSIIYRSVRKDLIPFNKFKIGNYSVVEDFSVLNNAVGDIIIGNNSRIGLGNTIIGPVNIGSYVNIAQHVIISGLNHNYKDITKTIIEQGVSTSQVTIEDNVWIGANAVVLPGIYIGTHSIVGAGSVISKNIPPYCVAIGNPAKVVKKYDFEKKEWIKV